MVLGDDVSTLETFVWILNHVYNLVSIRPKSMKLGQMINLTVIFHMVRSVYRLVTIRNSPQFPVEFRNGLLLRIERMLISETSQQPFRVLRKLNVVFRSSNAPS